MAVLAPAAPAGALDLLTSNATTQVQRRCFVDSVRVSGFFAQRAEIFMFGGPDGYRVAAISVQEGETVSAGQELIRLEPATAAPAVPGPPGQAAAAGRAAPPISLRAPAAGTVSAVSAQIGGITTGRTEPMLRIATSPDLDLVVDVPSAYVLRVKEGGGARILREDGSEVPTSVRVAPAEIDPRTQFASGRLAAPAGLDQRPGMFGRAFVDTDESCGPSVPPGAILRQNNTTSVLLMKDGKPIAWRVETGLSSSEYVEIVSGLSEGQQVVANAAGAL